MSGTTLIVCAAVGDVRGLGAAAAAVAVAATPVGTDWGGTVVLDLRTDARAPRGAVLAAAPARSLELTCGERDDLRAAARGRLCFATRVGAGHAPAAETLASFLADGIGPSLLVCIADPSDFRACLETGAHDQPAALLRAHRGAERSLLALASSELIGAGIRLKVWAPQIGLIAARRALAGIEPGGESGRRAARFAARLAEPQRAPRPRQLPGLFAAERAQALPAVLGVALVTIAVALILLAIGGAATAKGRLQRSVDLVALSAARSMRDDFPRLFVPERRADGSIDPGHLERSAYLERAREAGLEAAARNDLDAALVAIRFPDGSTFAPVRVVAAADVSVGVRGADDAATDARAEAEVSPPTGATPSAAPAMAGGGGYCGPARLPSGQADAPRRRRSLRPDGRRGIPKRGLAARQLRLPLRRGAAGPLGCQPGSANGRPAGHVAAPLRNRARSRTAERLWLAGDERGQLRLSPAVLLGGLAFRLHRWASSPARPRRTGPVAETSPTDCRSPGWTCRASFRSGIANR